MSDRGTSPLTCCRSPDLTVTWQEPLTVTMMTNEEITENKGGDENVRELIMEVMKCMQIEK